MLSKYYNGSWKPRLPAPGADIWLGAISTALSVAESSSCAVRTLTLWRGDLCLYSTGFGALSSDLPAADSFLHQDQVAA